MKRINILVWAACIGIANLTQAAGAFTDCDNAKTLIDQGAREKNLKKRIELYKKAVALCAEADAPHFFYGLALEEREDAKGKGANYTETTAEYRKVLSINPLHTGAMFKLAGIEYVSLRFDSAASQYSRFLRLEKRDDRNKELLESAQNLRAKCRWLAKLPPNAIKPGALTTDPERFAGVSSMIGRMAFEIGRSAMQVTGNMGYGLAGAGILLGIKALSNKTINFKKIESAFKAKNFPQALQISMTQLPKAVNMKGINSEEVFLLMVFINKCATALPGKLTEYTPYFEGLLALQKQFLKPVLVSDGVGEEYAMLMEFASANEHLGDVHLKRMSGAEAATCYRAARRLYQQYGGRFVKGRRIASASDKTVALMDFKYNLLTAQAESYADSTHSRALQTMADAFDKLQSDPNLSDNSGCWNRFLETLVAWGILSGNQSNNNLDDLLLFNNLTERLPAAKQTDSLSVHLTACRGNLMQAWGENNQALGSLKKVAFKSELYQMDKLVKYWSLHLFNTVFLMDSAAQVLHQMTTPDLSMLRYKESLTLAKRLIVTGRNTDAVPLLVACREMERKDLKIKNVALLPATTLLWIVLDSKSPEATQSLAQLLEHWQNMNKVYPDKFASLAASLLRSLVLPESYNPQKKQLFDQLMSICRQNEHCDPILQDDLRLKYYTVSHQWERAWEGHHNQALEPEAVLVGDHHQNQIFQPQKAQLAILCHETGRYKEAVELRRDLLGQLLPFEKELPENVADSKERLAESLAALGSKEEAMKWLLEANAGFDRLSPEPVTIRHQRARAALQKLKAGKSDIAFHGLLAFEFIR